VDVLPDRGLSVLAALGVAAGLFLLARGLEGYRSVVRVGDISTSNIDTLAVGEVRISGVVEPAEMTLVSLLQSKPCVYYESTIGNGGDRRTPDSGYTEERSIGFRVRDATGALRVFPRGARFDAPLRFEGETGIAGDEPPGLEIRREGSTRATETERSVAVADLLTVHQTDGPNLTPGLRDRRGRRTYRETRLEPGDPVTIIGRALPFADLPDPIDADSGSSSDPGADDPEIAADLAAARASGSLADDPAEAWGNAAIAGFGIGRPVTQPELDLGVHALPLAAPDEAARTRQMFDIAPDALVLAASAEVPLLIAHGIPGEIVARGQTQFIVGLLGAVLAIASAMVFAIDLGGGFGR
jgi:hypothetical protein